MPPTSADAETLTPGSLPVDDEESPAVSATTEQILSILASKLLLNYPLNRRRMETTIGQKIVAGRPINMFLPAFPCKSINNVRLS